MIKGDNQYGIVVINDIVFKGKRNVDWEAVRRYLQRYVGTCYQVKENNDIVYVGNEFPEEFAESESRKALKGTNAKAKANAATVIPELIENAINPVHEENKKEKHNKDAKNGWYRYNIKFAVPVYENGEILRYNIFNARLLVNHVENGKKYLYDILAIKKEMSKPQQ